MKITLSLITAVVATSLNSHATTTIRVDFTASASTGFAPLAGVFHDGSLAPFSAGSASAGLEALAEGGNPSAFIGEIQSQSSTAVIGTTVGQTGGTNRPGSQSFTVTIPDGADITSFNFASMFLPSNDWFITNEGGANVDITDLLSGTSSSTFISLSGIYDAGTELEDFTRGGGTGPDPFGLNPRLSDANGGNPDDQDDAITLVTQAAGTNLFTDFVNPDGFDISIFDDIVLGQEFGSITLTVVPEPSSAMLLLLGLAPLMRRKR